MTTGEEQGRLRDFFRQVFAHLRQKLPRASVKEIADAARKVAEEVRDRPVVGWDQADRVCIADARDRSCVHRAVRIIGHVRQLDDAVVISVPTGDDNEDAEFIEATSLVVEDLEGEMISTVDVLGRPLIETLRRCRRRGALTEFLGSIVLLPRVVRGRLTGQLAFYLQVLDVREAPGTLDLLGTTDVERASVTELRSRLRRANTSPLEYLAQKLVEGLRIVAVDRTTLGDLIDFVVLQAVSGGWVDHAPGNLHVLIVGPPGRGKKLAGLAAKCLNPVTVELSAAKASAAGLVGASFRRADGWTSTAGALPRATCGIAWLQDAHAWSLTRVRDLAPVLQELMEDGCVRDTVAGGQRRTTRVSLIIDANRLSQVRSIDRSEAAVLTVRPLLSRADAIIEIASNSDVPWDVATEMTGSIRSRSKELEDQPWVREAKLLVGALRDAYPEVDIEGVRPMMRNAIDAIRDSNDDYIDRVEESGDLPVRMVIGMTRLVIASARAHDRGVAIEHDVRRAVTFLNYKLRFLRMSRIDSVRMSERPNVREERQAWVAEQAREKPVSPDDLAHDYSVKTGTEIHQRTIRRDLRSMGARKVKKGQYLLPSADKRTNGHKDTSREGRESNRPQ